MKKKMKIKSISELIPPGMDMDGEITMLAIIYIISLVSFGLSLSAEELSGNNTAYLKYAIPLFIMVFSSVVAAMSNYIYFYAKSKSIYLMKRLPDAKELHIRCLFTPIVFLLAGIIIMILRLLLHIL